MCQLFPTVPVHFLVGTYPLLAVIFGCGYIFQFNRTTNSKWAIFLVVVSDIYSYFYFISAVNTRHMQRSDVLVQLGYIWRHVSAVNRPSSGQQVVVFISVINQPDAQNFCFPISLFHASTCFQHHQLIIRRSKLHYTASGIITTVGGRLVHE